MDFVQTEGYRLRFKMEEPPKTFSRIGTFAEIPTWRKKLEHIRIWMKNAPNLHLQNGLASTRT